MSDAQQPEILVSQQYKRNSMWKETWRRIFTNPGAVFGLFVMVLIFLCMFYSFIFITSEDVTRINSANRLQPPSREHFFGTDEFGRDLFARVMYGSRYSITVAFGAVGFAFVIGTFIGCIAGYFGGMVEELLMRLTELIAAVPALILGMIIVAITGPGLTILLIAVGVSTISAFSRMARAAVLTVRNSEYVEAARAIGMAQLRVIFRQVLPNSLSPLIVSATARMASAVLSAAGLSFLGFGVPVPMPEWGAIISGGRQYLLVAPHLTLFPGIFIMAMTFGCSLLGDGLRDALDPRLKT